MKKEQGGWIVVPYTDSKGNQSSININLDKIRSYRKWFGDEEGEKTVFFFIDNTKIVADVETSAVKELKVFNFN